MKQTINEVSLNPVYPANSQNWKEGDKIICINNNGLSCYLTVNKTYRVFRAFRIYKANQIDVIGDEGYLVHGVFSSRFTTTKKMRKEKLNKLNNRTR